MFPIYSRTYMSSTFEIARRHETVIAQIKQTPFRVFSVDNWTELGTNDGAELRAPQYWEFLEWSFIRNVMIYMLVWLFVNSLVAKHCWTSYQEGIKRKRLINVTTSLIHSSISGIYLFIFFCLNTRLMFASPLHYYNWNDSQIIILSVAYFFYDAYDLLKNDKLSISTGVLLFHHTASIFVLTTAVFSKKFLLYAYWAMLMEMSSIFLHIRSILHISKLSTTTMIGFSKAISYINLAAFIVFRFFIQIFLVGWAWENLDQMHQAFACIAFIGGLCFFLINCSLFLRLLHSDGFLLSSVVSQDRLDALLEDNEYSNSKKSVAKAEQKELLDV